MTKDCNQPKTLNLQVSEVHKALLSVVELVDAGHRVIFGKDWSFIQDKQTGRCDTMDRTPDGFDLITWVRAAGEPSSPDFTGQGR